MKKIALLVAVATGFAMAGTELDTASLITSVETAQTNVVVVATAILGVVALIFGLKKVYSTVTKS